VATHAVRHTDCSLETHSFFSHHLGDTLLPLFVIYSRHTTSSSHGDTRQLIRPTDPSRHTGNFLLFIVIGNTCRNSFLFTSILSTILHSLTHFFTDGVAVFLIIGSKPEFICCCGLFADEVFVFLYSLILSTFFFTCRPSDRLLLFIGELQAPAGIVDPIDGFLLLLIVIGNTCRHRQHMPEFFFFSSRRSNRRLLLSVDPVHSHGSFTRLVDPVHSHGSSFLR